MHDFTLIFFTPHDQMGLMFVANTKFVTVVAVNINWKKGDLCVDTMNVNLFLCRVISYNALYDARARTFRLFLDKNESWDLYIISQHTNAKT